MPDTFTCAVCGGTFEKGLSEEEALAELKGYFGSVRPDECSLVCDGCFAKIHPADHPREVENGVAERPRARLGPGGN